MHNRLAWPDSAWACQALAVDQAGPDLDFQIARPDQARHGAIKCDLLKPADQARPGPTQTKPKPLHY